MIRKKNIKYADDKPVMMTERHSHTDFEYRIPIGTDGDYVLILQFAEMYFKKAGKRKFHIKLGNRVVVHNVDIVANVGKYAVHQEYIAFTLRRDEILVNGELIPGAFRDNKLHIIFQKTIYDNPKVDGLVLFKGPLSETGYKSKEEI